ncbi:alkaline phosphatase D family protein [Nonomuraea endophytica]|uniref:alkaline phosphatase D family protein n=1 Tax=Nonomuraea endophytica TaxID=714136 RepID=UPI0037C9B4A2
MNKVSRRGFLTATLVAGSAAAIPGWVGAAGASSTPFTLGVASGDPAPDGVVLWTRLAPDPLAVDGRGGMPERPVPVQWQVATDEGFRRVVREGHTLARPQYGHSVHVELHGLRPGRDYFYRFRAGGEISPAGRTKTAPPPGARLDSLAFAFVSCQNWYEGYYTAYRHLAQEDLDVLFHLGDYLYEYGVGATGGVRGIALPEQYLKETFTLTEYRNRHALYRTDTDLQAAHAAFPWMVTVDDHDVENNWARDISQIDTEPDQDRQVFLQRRAAAFQAFYEHMPLRRSALPWGADMRLYRRQAFGRLAAFSVLDTRQYRDDQPCGDGEKVGCAERLDPNRTMLGERQEAWLLDSLGRSHTTWNILANQLLMAPLDHDAAPDVQSFGMDLWDGYAAARDRLLTGMVQRRVHNPVVISGDIHRSLAAELKTNFDDPNAPVMGVEFAGTSVSSGKDGADQDRIGQIFMRANPHLKFHNVQRGYVRAKATPDTLTVDYQVVPYVSRPGAPVSTRASFAVEAGRPGLHQTADNPPVGIRFVPDVASPLDHLAEQSAR